MAKKAISKSSIRVSTIPVWLHRKLIESADKNERTISKQVLVDLKKIYGEGDE
jgi:hypothetical protein